MSKYRSIASISLAHIEKTPGGDVLPLGLTLSESDLPNGVDAPGDLLGHIGVVHGVEMDALHPAGDEVGNLVDGVSDRFLLSAFS